MRVVRVLLCAFAVSLACVSGGARAVHSAESTVYRLTIASQPLGAALQEFARQTGTQVIFFSRLTDGLRAPALDGQYTIRSALTALLANSPLTFRMINSRTVEIRAVMPARTADLSGLAIVVRPSERVLIPESLI
jgi:Secretin and TonB N terminus short domain